MERWKGVVDLVIVHRYDESLWKGVVDLMIVHRYDESLWKGAIDLSGRTLRADCVHWLLHRGITVARLARAEVSFAGACPQLSPVE